MDSSFESIKANAAIGIDETFIWCALSEINIDQTLDGIGHGIGGYARA